MSFSIFWHVANIKNSLICYWHFVDVQGCTSWCHLLYIGQYLFFFLLCGSLSCRSDICHSKRFLWLVISELRPPNQYLWPNPDHPKIMSVCKISVLRVLTLPFSLFLRKNRMVSIYGEFNGLGHKTCSCAPTGSWSELIKESINIYLVFLSPHSTYITFSVPYLCTLLWDPWDQPPSISTLSSIIIVLLPNEL